MPPVAKKLTPSHIRLRATMLAWYAEHKRDLPWRRIKDPYAILVSEIMSQQTQIDRVVPKYEEFLTKFPSVQLLSRASTADVLRAWSGLGYNRRALFLHRASQIIAKNGWPKNVEDFCELPGIGKYTAGAVLSFAFQMETLAFDVNAERVLRRAYLGEAMQIASSMKKAEAFASRILPEDTGNWQQALMDIGSRYCRATPKCASCPFQKQCASSAFFLSGGKETSAKKKSVPFKESERFVRGQIVKALAKEKCMHLETIHMLLAQQEVETSRTTRALETLVRDGLIAEQNGIYALGEA